MFSPTVLVALPFLAALFAPAVCCGLKERASLVLALVPLTIFCVCLGLLFGIRDTGAFVAGFNWASSLSVGVYFLVDGLSLLFAMVISGVGALIVLYAGGYFHDYSKLIRFYPILFVFMGAMLGTVLSDNIVLLFIFWELTSLSSYLLIGFKHTSKTARMAALQALLVTGFGGLLMFFGLVLLGESAGSYQLSEIFSRKEAVIGHFSLTPMIVLILIGAFTKSAQFPFHFWLPNAMEAPTPVSAYLHSATMVKAGIFLVARLNPIFAGNPLWVNAITIVGFATFLLGAFLSLRRFDLKQVLAYTTVSSLGIIMMLIGVGTATSIVAAMVFLLAHAFYKGALFMIAGAVDHQAGSRDVRELGGLVKLMPITAAAAFVACFSMLGLPPSFGFVAKELFYEVFVGFDGLAGMLLIAVLLLAMAGLIAAALVVVILPFLRRPTGSPAEVVSEAPWPMWLPPMILSVIGISLGLFLEAISSLIVSPVVTAVGGVSQNINLELWHGVNLPLGLSVVTLIVGVVLFRFVQRIQLSAKLSAMERFGPESAYNFLYQGLIKFAAYQTRLIQSGYMRNYLLVIIFFTSALLITALFHEGLFPAILGAPMSIVLHEVVLGVVVLVGCFTLIRSRSRIGAVAAVGVVGYATALFFIFFSAPDLAMTQFAIETLVVILFIFVLYRLPKLSYVSSRMARIRDATLALGFGAIMTSLVLFISSYPLEQRITPYFAENSYLLAKGRNVVNVILVDFRALDTLGEIVVLAVAAIGVHALLRLRISSSGGK